MIGSGDAGVAQVEARFSHIDALAARGLIEFAPLDPGSVNFTQAATTSRANAARTYLNPESHVPYALGIAERHGLHPAFAIYEPSFIRAGAAHPARLDKLDLHLPLCTASLPIAAAAQFAFATLLPVAAALFAYTSIPTFRAARHVLFQERRLGVDVLDAIVVIGCLGTMSIFPGVVLCWCLSFGRVLVKRTQDNSKKLLLNAFGKQPRYVWLYRDGVEVQVSFERLQKASHKMAETLYRSAAGAQGGGDGGEAPAGGSAPESGGAGSGSKDDVIDAEYTEGPKT